MRVDQDTYVWGVKRILIERNTDAENPRTRIRLIGEDGEDANTTMTVWGERGPTVAMSMPEIAFVVDGIELNVLVPGEPDTRQATPPDEPEA